MTILKPATTDGFRVVICLAFDRRVSPNEIAAFKAGLWNCKLVDSCCELTGRFDFMLEAVISDLDSYKDHLKRIAEPLTRLVSRYESHFVSNRFVRAQENEAAGFLWVPSEDGHKRVDFSAINKITAERDYMRVHTHESSWLVHHTLRQMLHRLGDTNFVLIHRSTIVRWGFIERLVHLKRSWIARLDDGSSERIAKSQISNVLTRLKTYSSTSLPTSSKRLHTADPAPITERKAPAFALMK